ncbi:MAG: GNAT family N-acetyltransferase [Archangium sp.]|nr:GNAT family N-acetyltransferase [Archangium sp.]MDP3569159.1 GNAT family N-acetyltransferase [Archangium sp.]
MNGLNSAQGGRLSAAAITMNIFTTDAFLETAGALFYPERKRAIEVCRLEGRRLRLLVLDGEEVVGRMPFYDFPQPMADAKGPVDREIFYLPRTVLETVPLTGSNPPQPQDLQPSPWVDWKRLPTWKDFETLWRTSAVTRTHDGARQRRRLEKELGPVRFVLDDPRPEVFDACVQWKSSQYKATGLTDMFADPRNVALFRRLRERGVLQVSSFSAGETLLAVHFGSFHDGRFGWWVPAYDAKFGKFSPGRLMLEELLAASYDRGDLEFDFLIGDEAYKFQYATHNRIIGPVGTPPLKEVFLKKAKAQAKALLEKSPRAMELARTLQKRIRAAM